MEDYHRNWQCMSGSIIKAIHPSTVPLKIESGNLGVSFDTFQTVAFIKPVETGSDNEKKIFKQNNFTNLHLSTIGSQLICIEDQLTQIQGNQVEETTKDTQTITYPTNIKPPLAISGFKLNNPKRNFELLEELGKRLKGTSNLPLEKAIYMISDKAMQML